MSHTIETACRDCVFAEYRSGQQTGCAVGRLDKYKQQGVVTRSVDGGSSVIGRACLMHRQKGGPWADKTKPEDYAKKARQEIALKHEFIVIAGAEASSHDIFATVKSIATQTLKPRQVFLVFNRVEDQAAKLYRELSPILGETLLQIKTILERLPGNKPVSDGRCVDLCMTGTNNGWYSVFHAGFVVPIDFVESIDREVNDNVSRFMALWPNRSGEGLTVNIPIHCCVGGNRDAVAEPQMTDGLSVGSLLPPERVDSIIDKIQFMAGEKTYIVDEVTRVCPSMAP